MTSPFFCEKPFMKKYLIITALLLIPLIYVLFVHGLPVRDLPVSDGAISDSMTGSNGQAEIEWVKIDGGCFMMGDGGFYEEEQPVHRQCVDDFWMSATEITTAQFAVFVNETGYVTEAEQESKQGDGRLDINLPAGSMVFAPRLNMGDAVAWWRFLEGASWRPPIGQDSELGDSLILSRMGNFPVVHVTYADAMAFARFHKADLPNEIEWEYAAQTDEDEAAMQPDKANYWQGLFPFTNKAIDGYEGVAPVKSYPPNRFGLYDMIGNVWELTSSAYYPYHQFDEQQQAHYPQGFDARQPNRPIYVIKGGSFLCADNYCIRFRPAARQAQDAHMATSHIGFRIIRRTAPF